MPKVSGERLVLLKKKVGHERILTADERIDKDHRRHQQWLAKLSPKVAAASCRPYFDVPVESQPGKCFVYGCTQCSCRKNVCKFMRGPCSAAPALMPRAQWELAATGRVTKACPSKANTAAAKKARREKSREWRARNPYWGVKSRTDMARKLEELKKSPEAYRAHLDKKARQQLLRKGIRKPKNWKPRRQKPRVMAAVPGASSGSNS